MVAPAPRFPSSYSVVYRPKKRARRRAVWKKIPWIFLAFFMVGLAGILLWHLRDSQPRLWVQGMRLRQPAPSQDPQAKGAPFLATFESINLVQTHSPNQVLRAINRFVPNEGWQAEWPIEEYSLRFNMTIETGGTSLVTALVYIPQREPGDNRTFPLIVYGAGSTGLDERCAPSREDPRNPDVGNYPNQMIAQASQGFVVVMPNYEGLDIPNRTHSYFNAELEARTLLASAQTVLSQTEVPLPLLNNKVFFGGYSQGGHAAFAAADKAGQYAPDLEIGGIFGHGPTTDISDFLLMNPNLAPYFVFAYNAYYPDFNSEEMLGNMALRRLNRAPSLCVDEAFQYNSTSGAATYTAPFWAALTAEDADAALRQDFPALAALFEVNDAGTSYLEYPTLFLQGTGDPIVTPEAQQKVMDRICARGVPVTLKTYPNVHHWFTRQVSFKDTNDWIRAVSHGEAVDKVCN